jgi:predicted acyltransferase
VLQPGSLDTHRGTSISALALDSGLGLEVRATRQLTVAPFAGVRLAKTANFGPKYIVRAGVRVAFRR